MTRLPLDPLETAELTHSVFPGHNKEVQSAYFTLITSLLFCSLTWAQSSTYVSRVDSDLTIDTWTSYPLVDNLGGIYAKPLQAHLRSLMENDTEFRWVEASGGFKNAPEEFEEKSNLAADFMKKSKAGAFLAGRIAKGPQGLSIRLGLFSGSQGLPIGVETRSEIKGFEIEELKNELTQVYRQVKTKIPYRGVIMSRRGSNVTLNLGKHSGLQDGQEVFAIQITQAQRHPRFQFLISTEKEIMGKIRITKVDEALSFGTVTSERTEGLLKPGFKITFENFVKYAEPARTKDGQVLNDINQRPDADVAFGDNPKEWTPMAPPTFGKVALLMGLGSYSISNNIAAGSSSSRNSFVPSFHVESEMWLSAHWFLGLEFHQYVATVENGLSGSTPSKLDLQTLETELLVGYNVLVSEEFWGPKLQLMLGMSQMDSKIEGSTPTALTSNKYGGMALGVAGTLPLGQQTGLPVTAGGKFMYYWSPTLSESPNSSGSSTNRISTFSLFGEYQTRPGLAWKGELSFRQYNSNLSDSSARGATSISHAMTTLAGGVVFLF